MRLKRIPDNVTKAEEEYRHMKGKDRNALCWCGSGKKFKHCHRNRVDQTKDNPWDAVATNRKAFTEKRCFAHDVGLGPCEGRIVKAHTVSRGSNLSRIAIDGHVLHRTADISDLRRNGGQLSIKRIGIKDASVFYGFCAKHDRELFSCIENEMFVGRPEQCLAIAYRTISRELYGKDAAAPMRETLRGADKGLNPSEQRIMQTWLDLMATGNKAGRLDAQTTFDLLTSALVNDQSETIASIVITFDGPLPFMCAGAWSPFTDLYGKALQNGYSDEALEQVFVSSFAVAEVAKLCISWRNIAGAPGKVIADQIAALPADRQATAFLQIVVKHVENIFFNPDWHRDLAEVEKNQLRVLGQDGVDMTGSVPSHPIRLELAFGLPTAVDSFRV